MKRWSTEEDQILKDELLLGSTHEQIGVLLNRTKSSVMHRTQRLNLSKPNIQWSRTHTKAMILELIKKHKTAEEFDYNPEIPNYKSCLKILGVSTWAEATKMAGLTPNKGTRYDYSKPTTFYIIKCKDTDNTIFYKYGVTQRPITTRYSGKLYEVAYEKIMTLEEALNLEYTMDANVNKYRPKDAAFYSTGHGGYTECFICEQLKLPFEE